MENKQTAVEWAEDKLSDLNSAVVNGEIDSEEYHEIMVNIWNKAKAMQKEQIAEAFNNSYWFIDGIEYYEKTYGK